MVPSSTSGWTTLDVSRASATTATEALNDGGIITVRLGHFQHSCQPKGGISADGRTGQKQSRNLPANHTNTEKKRLGTLAATIQFSIPTTKPVATQIDPSERGHFPSRHFRRIFKQYSQIPSARRVASYFFSSHDDSLFLLCPHTRHTEGEGTGKNENTPQFFR